MSQTSVHLIPYTVQKYFYPSITLHYEKLDSILCTVFQEYISTYCLSWLNVSSVYHINILQGNQIYIPTQYICIYFYEHLQSCEMQLLALSCLSVHLSAQNNSTPTWQSFMTFDIWAIFETRENSSFIKILRE